MKRVVILLGIVALFFSSCVSSKQYAALESKERRTQNELDAARKEIGSLTEELNTRKLKCEELDNSYSKLKEEAANLQKEIEKQKNDYSTLQLEYNTMRENYKAQLTGKNLDLETTKEEMLKTRMNLEAREAELKEKEAKYAQLQDALDAKDAEIGLIREKLTNALVGFADKGLSVEVREGKVYVSMEEKLLFASGSWSVSKDGKSALTEVAKVLEENTDINVMIEGHTDNVALKGRNEVKDNWDLSVMRATSIVKVLLSEAKIDPSRITASGKGEFMPLVLNDTPQNKAKNRRSEIILTPKMDQVMSLINE